MEGLQYGIQQGYNPMTTAGYGSQPYGTQLGQPGQFGQQGVFGSAGNPLNGLIGSGLPGLLNGQNGGRPGIDGVNGIFQPYNNLDPMTAAYSQQAQLAQQVQLAQLAQHLAQQQQLGRMSSFGMDPMSAAFAQPRMQMAPQNQFAAPWLNSNPLNRIDPITAAYIQQAQIAQLWQQLALQGQLGQQGQYGHPFSNGQFGQGQINQGWLGGGQNPWQPQFGNRFGGTLPFQSGFIGAAGGYGGQAPAYY
jgi:hypothetical protein